MTVCIATLCLHMLYSLYNSPNLILYVYTAVKSVESNVLSGYKLWRTQLCTTCTRRSTYFAATLVRLNACSLPSSQVGISEVSVGKKLLHSLLCGSPVLLHYNRHSFTLLATPRSARVWLIGVWPSGKQRQTDDAIQPVPSVPSVVWSGDWDNRWAS